MQVPASPHFTPIDLGAHFNGVRSNLTDGLGQSADRNDWSADLHGRQTYRGIPFDLGTAGEPDVIVLEPGRSEPVVVGPLSLRATYLVFLQAVADRSPPSLSSFGTVGPSSGPVDGNDLAQAVSTYSLEYADCRIVPVPIHRRFAIQQRHIAWGASPFAAVPAYGPRVRASSAEDIALGRVPAATFGNAETRNESGRSSDGENLWLYALPNPHPDAEIRAIHLSATTEPSAVYAITTTGLSEHPLRLRERRKLRLRLPDGVGLNALGEIDTDSRADRIGIDLGTVISARAVLEYTEGDWIDGAPEVQPQRSSSEVVVEYEGHPDARLYLRGADGALIVHDLRLLESGAADDDPSPALVAMQPADRPVRFRILERGTGRRISARLHVHGEHGEYLPPRGHHRKVNTAFFEDVAGELASGLNQYAYVDGSCFVDLPLGRVFVEISRGFEFRPLRQAVEIGPDTELVTFELEDVLRWRERGWVTADTHVHFLSPQTALLEGQAEGVHVVNLLAAQWGEMFTNVGDFDGRTTFGAKDFGGDGEFMVRVGTENRMQVLGHISLLGYSGEMIHPLSTGGPNEGAIGDTLEVSMAEWATHCRNQNGLVVMPHAPNPQAERAADIVLGLVDAMEMMTFNPRDAQVSPHGLADWYRYQNVGYHLPLVAGSDKMTAAAVVGGIRTYAHLGSRPFTYGSWMDAVRDGNTFVTVGPLVRFAVEGRPAGAKLALSTPGGTVTIDWTVESISVVPKSVEVVLNGEVVEVFGVGVLAGTGQCSLRIDHSCWIALRVRGSIRDRDGDVAAHTSAVQITVGDVPIFVPTEATALLAQIEGSLAYIDTLAPRPEPTRHQKTRAALRLAHERLHSRLHGLGLQHTHAPIHAVHVSREH